MSSGTIRSRSIQLPPPAVGASNRVSILTGTRTSMSGRNGGGSTSIMVQPVWTRSAWNDGSLASMGARSSGDRKRPPSSRRRLSTNLAFSVSSRRLGRRNVDSGSVTRSASSSSTVLTPFNHSIVSSRHRFRSTRPRSIRIRSRLRASRSPVSRSAASTMAWSRRASAARRGGSPSVVMPARNQLGAERSSRRASVSRAVTATMARSRLRRRLVRSVIRAPGG